MSGQERREELGEGRPGGTGLLEHVGCAGRRGMRLPRVTQLLLSQSSSSSLCPPEGSWELGVQELLEHLLRALTAVQGGLGLALAAAAKEIQDFPACHHHCLSCFLAVLL